jgi:hypothetical protein
LGVGAVLGSSQSLPSIEELMLHPTVIETDQLGDEQANLLTMFLLMMIRQHIARQAKESPVTPERPVRHAVVLEEAHVLLGVDNGQASRSSEDANPQQHAAHRISRMIKEVRAQGECVVICDQSADAIHPEVSKQAQVRIAHQVIDSKGREDVANAMLLTDEEADETARLRPGEAFLWYGGLQRPVKFRSHYVNEGICPPCDDVLRGILGGFEWYRQHCVDCLRNEISDRLDRATRGLQTETVDSKAQHELARLRLYIRSRLELAKECGLPADVILASANQAAEHMERLNG